MSHHSDFESNCSSVWSRTRQRRRPVRRPEPGRAAQLPAPHPVPCGVETGRRAGRRETGSVLAADPSGGGAGVIGLLVPVREPGRCCRNCSPRGHRRTAATQNGPGRGQRRAGSGGAGHRGHRPDDGGAGRGRGHHRSPGGAGPGAVGLFGQLQGCLGQDRGQVAGGAPRVSPAAWAPRVIVFAGLLLWQPLDRAVLVIGAVALAGRRLDRGGAIFATLDEEAQPREEVLSLSQSIGQLRLVREDGQLARFIVARSLLVGSALAPPYLLVLAAAGQGDRQLGLLVLASALASLLSSWVWGRDVGPVGPPGADLVGRRGAIALGAALVLAATGLAQVTGAIAVVLFGLMIAYHGVRQGGRPIWSTWRPMISAPPIPRCRTWWSVSSCWWPAPPLRAGGAGRAMGGGRLRRGVGPGGLGRMGIGRGERMTDYLTTETGRRIAYDRLEGQGPASCSWAGSGPTCRGRRQSICGTGRRRRGVPFCGSTIPARRQRRRVRGGLHRGLGRRCPCSDRGADTGPAGSGRIVDGRVDQPADGTNDPGPRCRAGHDCRGPGFHRTRFWAGFSPDQRESVMRDGRVALPSEYGEPLVLTRRLIEDGRDQLVLNQPLSLLFRRGCCRDSGCGCAGVLGDGPAGPRVGRGSAADPGQGGRSPVFLARLSGPDRRDDRGGRSERQGIVVAHVGLVAGDLGFGDLIQEGHAAPVAQTSASVRSRRSSWTSGSCLPSSNQLEATAFQSSSSLARLSDRNRVPWMRA